MSILVIAGLGNPGDEYRHTRHNIGFEIVDSLNKQNGGKWKSENRFEAEVARLTLDKKSLLLVKPLTYMNESGRSLNPLCDYYKIAVENLIIVADEVQINLGEMKITTNGSAGGHNGIDSVIQHLGDGFSRFRIGIGPKVPPEIELKVFVLSKFNAQEQEVVNNKMSDYLTNLQLLIDRGPNLAMNQINKRNKTTDESNFN